MVRHNSFICLSIDPFTQPSIFPTIHPSSQSSIHPLIHSSLIYLSFNRLNCPCFDVKINLYFSNCTCNTISKPRAVLRSNAHTQYHCLLCICICCIHWTVSSLVRKRNNPAFIKAWQTPSYRNKVWWLVIPRQILAWRETNTPSQIWKIENIWLKNGSLAPMLHPNNFVCYVLC